MTPEARPEVHRFHVWIRQISPMIWRRLLVRSDSTIADLHYTLQIAFGWTDAHTTSAPAGSTRCGSTRVYPLTTN